MEDAMVPPFTQNSGHSVDGDQKIPGFKGMAAWRRASWHTLMAHLVTSIYTCPRLSPETKIDL